MIPSLSVGLGVEPVHYDLARITPQDAAFLEVRPENHMVRGGPRLASLEAIRARHPVSFHGAGLSLATDAAPDPVHLARLRDLVRRFEPALVSEHLAWSAWGDAYYPDPLPFPRTESALGRICDNVNRVQEAIGCRISIENPAHYLKLAQHRITEIDFLGELARRTGCGLLLDVTNAYVSARNLGMSAERYLDAFPGSYVTEIHLSGYTTDSTHETALVVDSRDAPVAGTVWALYERLVDRIGPRPTLIERNGHAPRFETLQTERVIAQSILERQMRAAA